MSKTCSVYAHPLCIVNVPVVEPERARRAASAVGRDD